MSKKVQLNDELAHARAIAVVREMDVLVTKMEHQIRFSQDAIDAEFIANALVRLDELDEMLQAVLEHACEVVDAPS